MHWNLCSERWDQSLSPKLSVTLHPGPSASCWKTRRLFVFWYCNQLMNAKPNYCPSISMPDCCFDFMSAHVGVWHFMQFLLSCMWSKCWTDMITFYCNSERKRVVIYHNWVVSRYSFSTVLHSHFRSRMLSSMKSTSETQKGKLQVRELHPREKNERLASKSVGFREGYILYDKWCRFSYIRDLKIKMRGCRDSFFIQKWKFTLISRGYARKGNFKRSLPLKISNRKCMIRLSQIIWSSEKS